MRYRFQPWQLAAFVVVLCAGAVALVHWRRVSRPFDAVALIECLPPDQSTHVYIDVDALRRSGILDSLAGAKTAEEPDYRRFVEQTGFDYRTDLDAVAAAFFHGNVYLAVRGRFEWKQLSDYARAQGGQCRNAVCEMPASQPERYISFYPLRSDILAIAVSSEERGVVLIGPGQWKNPPHLPPEPVWISAPSYMFSDVKDLPAGTHSFLSPLAQAKDVTFAIGPAGGQSGGQAADGRLGVRLEVTCYSAEAAAALAKQLTETTDLLKNMLEREHMTSNPDDLSGVLVAGSFEQHDQRVIGKWPLERGFVDALLSGKVE